MKNTHSTSGLQPVVSRDASRETAIWIQFTSRFPKEEDCIRVLRRTMEDIGMSKCQGCRCDRLTGKPEARAVKCSNCNKVTWLTARTFFHRIRLVRPWLAAIWLLEHGVSISASRFHKLVGIAYSSAFNLLKKLTMVIESQMGTDFELVSSALFSAVICKRSRQTPREAHPRGEEAAIGKLPPELVPGAQQENSFRESSVVVPEYAQWQVLDLFGNERKVYENLSVQPIHSDLLCKPTGLLGGQISAALMMLELKGFAKYVFGTGYVRCMPQSAQQAERQVVQHSASSNAEHEQMDVRNFVCFVKQRFHGISRKYLQCYVSAHWCEVDSLRWAPGSLLLSCLNSTHIKSCEIRQYITPQRLKVPVILLGAEQAQRA